MALMHAGNCLSSPSVAFDKQMRHSFSGMADLLSEAFLSFPTAFYCFLPSEG